MSMVIEQILSTRRLSHRELSRRTKIPHSTLTDKLNGKTRWYLEDLFTIADGLDVNPEDLVIEILRVAEEDSRLR